jgi:selenocysteine-specific elongation factor
MRRLILGTAGHIDHGKTALIKALTGIDTDRLEEEKTRGISIDLGFAHLDLPSGSRLGIVDVPGHERFIKNMLAGIGGIDLVLFVVACDEGVMPQTTEHFDIVSLLGVRHAIFALTKQDLVGEDMVDIVREDVEGLIRGTPLEGSPIIPTSTETGRGMEGLLKILDRVALRVEERKIGEAIRLPIDRVFTMAGRGTVVTGTLWSGTVSKEDRLEMLPGGRPVRVRSIEVHGKDVDRALAGQRTALGLHGVETGDIERGYCIASPGDFQATSIIDARLYLLPGSPKPVRTNARVRFHLGSSEVMGRVFLIGSPKLQPGDRCFVQIRLESPVVAGLGDRFVIRTYSPMRTIGGGMVLDPAAPRHRLRDERVEAWLGVLATLKVGAIVEAYIRQSTFGIRLGGLRRHINCGLKSLEAEIESLVGQGKVFEVSQHVFLHRERLRDLEERIENTLRSYQADRRLTWGMPKEELREKLGSIEMALLSWVLARLEQNGRTFNKKGMVRAGTAEVELSARERDTRKMLIDTLRATPFQPPSERELEGRLGVKAEMLRKVVNLLIEDGEIIRLEAGLIMHRDAIEAAKARISEYLKQHGEGTASELKGVLQTTRKYAVPLLEFLDREGITRRRGDKRTLPGSEPRN